MIRSFRHKGLEDFFFEGSKKGIRPEHSKKLAALLDRLDSAQTIEDMDFPGSYLHPLKGDKKGHWAVRVSGNWRLTFRCSDGDAFDVDSLDYH